MCIPFTMTYTVRRAQTITPQTIVRTAAGNGNYRVIVGTYIGAPLLARRAAWPDNRKVLPNETEDFHCLHLCGNKTHDGVLK